MLDVWELVGDSGGNWKKKKLWLFSIVIQHYTLLYNNAKLVRYSDLICY